VAKLNRETSVVATHKEKEPQHHPPVVAAPSSHSKPPKSTTAHHEEKDHHKTTKHVPHHHAAAEKEKEIEVSKPAANAPKLKDLLNEAVEFVLNLDLQNVFVDKVCCYFAMIFSIFCCSISNFDLHLFRSLIKLLRIIRRLLNNPCIYI
jgi:hypothetical protein